MKTLQLFTLKYKYENPSGFYSQIYLCKPKPENFLGFQLKLSNIDLKTF